MFDPFWDPMNCSVQALLFMVFPRQEYWSGLPCPPPGDRPNPGIKLGSPALQADSLPCEVPGKPFSTGILQARILECVAMPSSRGSSQPRDQTRVSGFAGRCFPAEPPGRPGKVKQRSIHVYLFLYSSFSFVDCCRVLAHVSRAIQ